MRRGARLGHGTLQRDEGRVAQWQSAWSTSKRCGVRFPARPPDYEPSSKVGPPPFKRSNAGSNPVGSTNCFRSTIGRAPDYESGGCRFEPGRELQFARAARRTCGRLLIGGLGVRIPSRAPTCFRSSMDEHSTPNREVEGSIPSGSSRLRCWRNGRRVRLKSGSARVSVRFRRIAPARGRNSARPEYRPFKSGVAGSNPRRPHQPCRCISVVECWLRIPATMSSILSAGTNSCLTALGLSRITTA